MKNLQNIGDSIGAACLRKFILYHSDMEKDKKKLAVSGRVRNQLPFFAGSAIMEAVPMSVRRMEEGMPPSAPIGRREGGIQT